MSFLNIRDIFKTTFDANNKEIKNLKIVELEKLRKFIDKQIDKFVNRRAQIFMINADVPEYILAEASKIKINIPQYSYDELKNKAVKEKDVPNNVMHRKMVNYLRHTCSQYEGELAFNKYKSDSLDRHMFHRVLKKMVLADIKNKYPELIPECEDQENNIE